jgi:hypothetical protein
MKLFIPENLDLDLILSLYPPVEIENFKKDYLIYILHLIKSIPATNKDLVIVEGFVPIYSKILQRKVRNYRQYLDYLIYNSRVLETDNNYLVGCYSKGYRVIPKYNSQKVKPTRIYDRSLIAAIRRESRFPLTTKNKYKHLIKWFNEDLQIDYDLAMSFIEDDLARKLANPDLRDYDKKAREYKDPYNQYNCAALNIERIASGQFMLSIDANVYRMHSVLTNLRSEVRNCLSYAGQPVVSIDIKNSQPYMSTGILKSSFWIDNRNIGKNQPKGGFDFSIYNISESLLWEIFCNKSQIISYIMLCKYAESIAGSDLQRFSNLVQKGVFYEYLADEIGRELGVEYSDRKKVKAAVFQVLFTDNRFLRQEEAQPKRIFRDKFPFVYKLFSLIKRQHKSNLPRLLQRIESHLMLLVVTKRIARERPDLPIFTIHDSIVTTVGNEIYVSEVLKQELDKAIGCPPQVSLDYWTPSNLKFNDGIMFLGDIRLIV